MNVKLVGHHVGGRNATVSFLPPRVFQRDFVSVLYDADPECVEQILEKTADRPYAVKAFPYCLGAGEGSATFNINYCSYTSSMLDLNDRYARFYEFTEPMDYVFGDTLRTMERIPVKVIDLDSVIANDPDVPPPDFLSLDVEGAEIAVLNGAKKTLDSNVLGLVTEITFHEIRKGQSLFDNVRPLLDKAGFDFVRFTYLHDFSPTRGPVGARGKGYQLNGDALFIRRLDTLAAMSPDAAEQYGLAVKLAFIAVTWGLLEYAGEVYAWAQNLGVVAGERRAVDETTYGRFMTRLQTAVQGLRIGYPPIFSELMNYETSRSRSRPVNINTHTGWKFELKEWLLARPVLLGSLRKARYALWDVRDLVNRAGSMFFRMMQPRHSPVERVLVEHGFSDLAAQVRKRRLAEQPYARAAK